MMFIHLENVQEMFEKFRKILNKKFPTATLFMTIQN